MNEHGMTVARKSFYGSVLAENIPDKDAQILICGGGIIDKEVFEDLDYRNVTISNLDPRQSADTFQPFDWAYQRMEALTYDDDSFDYVVAHAAVHHARSPHKALTEMVRVSKLGTLILESRDSTLMRLMKSLGISQSFETAAVFYNDCEFGGVDNTHIPNFIFRWTEREVVKTLASYFPEYKIEVDFKYGTDIPCTPSRWKNRNLKSVLVAVGSLIYPVFSRLFPNQRNLFAFHIKKPGSNKKLQPWLKVDSDTGDLVFDRSWGEARYK